MAGRALGLQLPAFVPACWRLCMVQTWSFQVRFCLAPSNLPLPHQCCGALSLSASRTSNVTQGFVCWVMQAHKALLGLPSGCHQCAGRPWHRSSCSESILCTPRVMPMYTKFVPSHCVFIVRRGLQASTWTRYIALHVVPKIADKARVLLGSIAKVAVMTKETPCSQWIAQLDGKPCQAELQAELCLCTERSVTLKGRGGTCLQARHAHNG